MKSKFTIPSPISFEKAKEKNVVDFPYIAEPFLNGVKCYIKKNDDIQILTSKHEVITTCPHILETKTIKNFFENYPNGVLEGELYSNEMGNRFNKLIKSNEISDDDKQLLKEKINFHCFDLSIPEKSELKTLERKNVLISVISNISDIDDREDDFYIGGLMIIDGQFRCYIVNNEVEIDLIKAKYKRDGYSGIILKKDEPYMTGKKTKSLKITF